MNMQKLMKQAQEMQEKMQRDLGETEIETSVGGGMVKIRMNGHKQLLSVKIDEEAFSPDGQSMLEDLILVAVNDAARSVDETLRSKMGSLAGSMPGLF